MQWVGFTMENWQVALITLASVIILKVVAVLLVSGFRWNRITTAACVGWHSLATTGTAERLAKVVHGESEPAKPARSSEPIRLLALLQRDSRLVDLLLEDLSGCDDAQVGAGARGVLVKARTTMLEHLKLEPCLPGQENDKVTVPSGFAPGSITLTGQVTGNGPFQGILRHPGWKVTDCTLPEPLKGQDGWVIVPAEVEVG